MDHEADLSPYLGSAIRQHEGSLGMLKSKVSSTVLGMTSCGYVWFVTDQSGITAVVPTFASGTLLVRSRRQQTPFGNFTLGKSRRALAATKQDSNPVAESASGTSPNSPTSGTFHSSLPLNPSTPSRALHTSRSYLADFSFPTTPADIYSESMVHQGSYVGNKTFDLTTLGETLFPLFCISVHERAWISAGYGVWGKEEWLKHFWTVLDWSKVSEAYKTWVPDSSTCI